MRMRWVHYASMTIMSAVLVVSSSAIASAGTPSEASAEYRGHAIALAEVSSYHCHDLAYPVIKCFDSAADRDVDLAATAEGGADLGLGPDSVTLTSYVTWFAAANYGGSSFTASFSYANLGTLGWNDSISSFKSLNNGRPKWWQATNYTGTSWRWLAGAQVSYVGDAANDQFSSVQNVP